MTDPTIPPMVPSAEERAIDICSKYVGFDRPEIGIATGLTKAFRDGALVGMARYDGLKFDIINLITTAVEEERSRILAVLRDPSGELEDAVTLASREGIMSGLRAAAEWLENPGAD